MNLQPFPEIITDISESLGDPVDKFWMLILPYSVSYALLTMSKIYVNFIRFRAVYIKISNYITNTLKEVTRNSAYRS